MYPKKNLPAKIVFFLALTLAALPARLNAEVLGSDGWALDIPEGYILAEKSGTTRYHLTNSLYPVELQIAVYPLSQFPDASKALAHVTGQLKSTGTEVSLSWRNRRAAIGRIEAKSVAGWAEAVELDNKKGWLALACYADEARAVELEALMVSTLDSVCTDQGSYFESGPMTAFAWPKGKEVGKKFTDGNASQNVPLREDDESAAQSVVDREFSLLTAYLGSEYVIPAWQRYYRMIWRDSWARLTKAIFSVGAGWPTDSRALTEKTLAWTQSFSYERNFSGSDFTNLPEAFIERKGDCDARALLMVLMLNELGVDAVLLVSPDYSHAVAAVDCPGEGARFTVGGKKYLLCDTTAKVGPGLIAADMADPAKWFAVSFFAFPQAEKR